MKKMTIAEAVAVIQKHSDGGSAMTTALAALSKYAQSAHAKARLGGLATARSMTKAQKTERARKAAIARWSASRTCNQ